MKATQTASPLPLVPRSPGAAPAAQRHASPGPVEVFNNSQARGKLPRVGPQSWTRCPAAGGVAAPGSTAAGFAEGLLCVETGHLQEHAAAVLPKATGGAPGPGERGDKRWRAGRTLAKGANRYGESGPR